MTCTLCAKRHMSGNKRSHSNIKTRKQQGANVQRIRAVVGGRRLRVKACSRCIRSGLVQKPARGAKQGA